MFHFVRFGLQKGSFGVFVHGIQLLLPGSFCCSSSMALFALIDLKNSFFLASASCNSCVLPTSVDAGGGGGDGFGGGGGFGVGFGGSFGVGFGGGGAC